MGWIVLYLAVGWLLVELGEWAVRSGRVDAMDNQLHYLWILLAWPVVFVGCAMMWLWYRRDNTDE